MPTMNAPAENDRNKDKWKAPPVHSPPLPPAPLHHPQLFQTPLKKPTPLLRPTPVKVSEQQYFSDGGYVHDPIGNL